MDDDASSNDIYVGTGTYFPQVGRQLNASSPIFADVDVADVTKMKFAFAPFSVSDADGIPMPASRLSIRGAAVAVLVNMDGMKPRGSADDFDEERNLVANLCESRCSRSRYFRSPILSSQLLVAKSGHQLH